MFYIYNKEKAMYYIKINSINRLINQITFYLNKTISRKSEDKKKFILNRNIQTDICTIESKCITRNNYYKSPKS